MPRSITEIAAVATGGILAISGLLAALGTLKDKAQPVLDWLGMGQSPWVSWAITGTLILAGLWLLGRGLSRKSRLLQPERLLIRPGQPGASARAHRRGPPPARGGRRPPSGLP